MFKLVLLYSVKVLYKSRFVEATQMRSIALELLAQLLSAMETVHHMPWEGRVDLQELN